MALSITYSSELYNVVTFVKNVSFYQVKSIMLYNAHTTHLTFLDKKMKSIVSVIALRKSN